jgi:serine protease DegQ
MSAITDFSNALGEAVAGALRGVLPLHHAGGTTSGIVFDEHHLVAAARAFEPEGAVEAEVGGDRLAATLVGSDPATDVAVFRVERPLTPLARADETALRPGHLVVAVAQGSRGARARMGIVSRLGGPWQLGGGARFERYIETDILPAPALSGSALVDATGALLGINAAGLVRGALVTLPASALAPIVGAIVSHGRVRRAKLGVALQRVEVPAPVAAQRGQPNGLIVLGVAPGGPAERAGVLVGDVLLAVGGTRVARVDELQGVLDESKIDAETSIELLRAGAETSLNLRPEAR